jgi:hypothetical protein
MVQRCVGVGSGLLWTYSVAKWVLVHWLLWQGGWTMMTAGKESSWSVTLREKLYIASMFWGALNILTGDKLWVVHSMGKWMKYTSLSEEHVCEGVRLKRACRAMHWVRKWSFSWWTTWKQLFLFLSEFWFPFGSNGRTYIVYLCSMYCHTE